MTLQVVNYEKSGPDTPVNLGTLDDLWVGRAGLVLSTNGGYAIYGFGSYHTLHIEGAVSGGNGIYLGYYTSLDSYNSVVIASTGVVYGIIYSIHMSGINARLDNFGLLDGTVYFEGYGPSQSRIYNAGDIIDNDNAIVHVGTETLSLSNTGTIRTAVATFVSTDATAIDLIRNRGDMTGDILLGGGDDRYDGRGGFVDGTVFGEAGNDTFRPGGGIELFDGGLGVDTLDFRSTSGVRVYLDGSGPNTGSAEGDDYVGIETMLGSARGADVLGGDAANNVLRGYGGADTLAGGSGADALVAGVGIDLVFGGLGDDSFYFEKPGDGGDVIGDFAAVVGNNDTFRFWAPGFGGGLVAGALPAAQFQSRADNLAQDADDRFIFRTTDQTLWFDSNGNGAGGLTLVADLQSGAVVTAADILIY